MEWKCVQDSQVLYGLIFQYDLLTLLKLVEGSAYIGVKHLHDFDP